MYELGFPKKRFFFFTYWYSSAIVVVDFFFTTYTFFLVILKIIHKQRKQHGNTYNRLYIYIYVYAVYRGETRHYFIKGKRIIIVFEAFIVVAVIYFIFLVQHIKGHLIINNK